MAIVKFLRRNLLSITVPVVITTIIVKDLQRTKRYKENRSKAMPVTKVNMFERRWWSFYRALGIVIGAYAFGCYIENEYNERYLTKFRNKSKLFGGKEYPPGEKPW